MSAPVALVRRRVLLALALAHAALVSWALRAWVHGPFLGRGVLDGHEVLELARRGSAGAFETKSPLHPWLLGVLFDAFGDSPWTVGLLGLAASLAVFAAVARLCTELECARAAPWACGLYAFSGSSLAFAVQPLPVMLASALLAWGAVACARAARDGRARDGLAAGALLGACVFTRAPLAIAAALLLAPLALRRRLPAAGAALAGLVAAALLAFAAFGARAWPSGSMLNLRQGNGAARTGISDVRPGPVYDRVRLEAAFAPAERRGAAPAFEPYQRAALVEELRADPVGAALTLARKAYLFWFRTETVTGADFRHGLRDLPAAPWLLASFGLVAPLGLFGLAGLLRRREPGPALAVLGLFAVNVVWLTSARYRFPALPFLCVAAGAFVAARPSPRAWLGALLLALPLNLALAGVALTVPGDGLVQEGRLWLERDRTAPRARAAYEEALAAGSRDPRAHYELALVLEAAGDADALDLAEEHYEAALVLDPAYPEAAENLVALLLRRGRLDEAIERAQALTRASPHAAKVWLNLAGARARRDPGSDVRALEAEGFLRLALRALAQNDREGFDRWSAEARARGVNDARLAGPGGR